jgi:glutaredoxin
MMRVIRFVLGRIILFLNWLIQPRALVRETGLQRLVDQQTKNLTLYQFKACPFCVKVRRQILRLGLNIELKDAQNDAQAINELLQGGKHLQVPCLRIQDGTQTQWMYESSDINAYLQKQFG